MAIASITSWLNDPDRSYQTGLLLYEQYGDNRVLISLFKSGSTSFHFSKLNAALQELNTKANLEPRAIAISDQEHIPAANENKFKDRFENAPEKILEIRNEKNRRYAQARRLFESIRVLDSKDLRRDAALQLLDHMDYVNQAWMAIDEWRESGQIQEIQEKESESDVSQLSLVELLQEAKNLPTYISKDRQKLKAENLPSKQAKISFRLNGRLHRLELVKRRLNELV